MSLTTHVYAAILSDSDVFKTRVVEMTGVLGYMAMVLVGRGLLYEDAWSTVSHAIYFKQSGMPESDKDYECLGSWNGDGNIDSSVEEAIRATIEEDNGASHVKV